MWNMDWLIFLIFWISWLIWFSLIVLTRIVIQFAFPNIKNIFNVKYSFTFVLFYTIISLIIIFLSWWRESTLLIFIVCFCPFLFFFYIFIGLFLNRNLIKWFELLLFNTFILIVFALFCYLSYFYLYNYIFDFWWKYFYIINLNSAYLFFATLISFLFFLINRSYTFYLNSIFLLRWLWIFIIYNVIVWNLFWKDSFNLFYFDSYIDLINVIIYILIIFSFLVILLLKDQRQLGKNFYKKVQLIDL